MPAVCKVTAGISLPLAHSKSERRFLFLKVDPRFRVVALALILAPGEHQPTRPLTCPHL